MPSARVHRISANAPDDFSGLEAAIDAGAIDPASIIAIFGKTEGNGLVNDFSRALAVEALRRLLHGHLADLAVRAVCTVMSGGTEGGMAPHWLVFERRPGDAEDFPGAALAVGRAHTTQLPTEHLGRIDQARMVAEGVATAMKDAGITNADDVHFVQIKCPLLTAKRIRKAEASGKNVVIRDTLKSMGWSRGASAIGVGPALGEIDHALVTEGSILNDRSLWSARASASAGIELLSHEIVVLGMSSAWSGPLAIDHTVMADGIDVGPVRDTLARLGADPGQPSHKGKVVGLLAKAEASTDGILRGSRHTMNDDSDISSTRHARAFVAGALGAVISHAELFVSGGAEHQGPDGGGPVAIIVQREKLCP